MLRPIAPRLVNAVALKFTGLLGGARLVLVCFQVEGLWWKHSWLLTVSLLVHSFQGKRIALNQRYPFSPRYCNKDFETAWRGSYDGVAHFSWSNAAQVEVMLAPYQALTLAL